MTIHSDTNSRGACRRQVELVQDLEFPAACHRMKATSDGQFLFATGIHAPRLRVYELGQLSMKFERHFDSEIIDFQVCHIISVCRCDGVFCMAHFVLRVWLLLYVCLIRHIMHEVMWHA